MVYSGHPHNTKTQRNGDTSGATTTPTTPMAPTAPTTPTVSITTVPVCTAPFINSKWVINLLTMPLTSVQEALLARGPNFKIVPKYTPGKLTF